MSNCIVIDKEKCVGCGMCTKDCPHHAIEIKNGKANMLMDNSKSRNSSR